MYRTRGGRNHPEIAQPGVHVSRRPIVWWFLTTRNNHTIVSTTTAICSGKDTTAANP